MNWVRATMKVYSSVLECMHLDPGYALLTVKNIITCLEYFRLLDVHSNTSINDCLFWAFLRSVTDISREDAATLFHLLDITRNGEMEFEEFYLVFCVLIASLDKSEKEFIYRHSGSIFRLIDYNASGLVSKSEFRYLGVLFNFNKKAMANIFDEFDISGDKNLDFEEFRLFAMACIDGQRVHDAQNKIYLVSDFRQNLLRSLKPLLIRYVSLGELPAPDKLVARLRRVTRPDQVQERPWVTWCSLSHLAYSIRQTYRNVLIFLERCWLLITKPFTAVKKVKSCFGQMLRKLKIGNRYNFYSKEAVKEHIHNYKYFNRNKRYRNIKPIKYVGGHVHTSSQGQTKSEKTNTNTNTTAAEPKVVDTVVKKKTKKDEPSKPTT